MYCGTWVDLPEPVSLLISTTWEQSIWLRIAVRILNIGKFVRFLCIRCSRSMYGGAVGFSNAIKCSKFQLAWFSGRFLSTQFALKLKWSVLNMLLLWLEIFKILNSRRSFKVDRVDKNRPLNQAIAQILVFRPFQGTLHGCHLLLFVKSSFLTTLEAYPNHFYVQCIWTVSSISVWSFKPSTIWVLSYQWREFCKIMKR